MAAKRKVDTLDIEVEDGRTAEIISEALPYEQAEDLLPEIVGIVGAAFDAIAPAIASGVISGEDDVVKLLPLLPGLAGKLGGGRLRQLSPRILAGTQVLVKGGDAEKYDLCNKSERADCFDARPQLYLACLFHAGRVTFGPFFSARGLLPRQPAPPSSETPST
jgi:hypothetical protein